VDVERRRAAAEAADAADAYRRLKLLERQLEFLAVQEEYVKDEHKNLKRELLRAQEEVKRIQSVPLVIGQFLEPIDEHYGIVGSTTGSNSYVRILSTLDRCVPGAHTGTERPADRPDPVTVVVALSPFLFLSLCVCVK
jgi:26S proteasome regulatory subunit T3